ncbi:MAG: hypothetical protein ACFE0Q_13665 [Anaerolineae bacterium]
MTGKYHSLVERFLIAEPIHRMAARMILIALDEDAVEPLIDAYFAGVTDQQGIAILDLLADIGGYDALNVMRDIIKHQKDRPPLRVAAVQGLLRNADNLSSKEVRILKRFITKHQDAE